MGRRRHRHNHVPPIGAKAMRATWFPFDWWSLAHVSSGVLLAFAGVPWYGMLALGIGYEGFEAGLRMSRAHARKGVFEPETWGNMMADVLVDMVGWAAAAGAVLWWHLPHFG